MENQLLKLHGFEYEYKACFATLSQLNNLIQDYLLEKFPTLAYCEVTFSDVAVYLKVWIDDEDEETSMSEKDLERFVEEIGNPQEEIMNFRTVIEKIFGKGSFVELIDENNINIFVPLN